MFIKSSREVPYLCNFVKEIDDTNLAVEIVLLDGLVKNVVEFKGFGGSVVTAVDPVWGIYDEDSKKVGGS